ncbi:MAG TPA: RluA family pseudouridine synthase, partial [Desulfocapsa sulfexigens]|nr:RluA family pseudouridine synthase [Desulfobacterales bacterium]HIQ37117.1 RluA family pseudouridine synthase [Desulfocapsa sulfexigens]
MKTMQVIYEEPEFVVVVKSSGLLSVPGRGPENLDCVSERVKALYPGCIEQPSVHRLDMDTSGLLVIARTKEVHRNISIQFQEREVNKRYIAILDGELDGEEGIIELPFRLDIDNRPHQIYDPVHGKVGITHWKKLLVKDGKTRIEFKPITGRTHQLRVHSASEHGLGI